MSATPVNVSAQRVVYGLALVLWLGVAAAVWTWAVPMQWARGCWLGEWPFEQGCDDRPSRALTDNPSEALQTYLQGNVGDAHAYVRLMAAWAKQDDPRWLPLLEQAQALAPVHDQTMVYLARHAIATGDAEAAATALTTLVDRKVGQALPMLRELMKVEAAQPHLLALITPDSAWLQATLNSWEAKAPVTPLLPFVDAGKQAGAIRPDTLLRMVDRLRREGNWFDAYALWVSYHGKVPEGVFNAGFDQAMSRRGFDWEWVVQPLDRQGYRVDQVSASPKKGMVAELELTGRSALPPVLLSQTLFLFGPHYRLQVNMLTDNLKTTEGLVWAVRCAAGGDRLAQTEAIKNTQRTWVTRDFEFNTKAECGGVYRLQLEPTAAWEARAGMTGTLLIDDLTLTNTRTATQ